MPPTFMWRKPLMDLMVEALNLCLQEIEKNAAPGNTKVKDKLDEYLWTRNFLAERAPENGHTVAITLDTEVLQIIKGALLYYSQHLKRTREQVAKTATVQEGATEELDAKLQRIEDFTRGPAIGVIKPDGFLKPPQDVAAASGREPIITDPELAKTVRALVDADDGTNDRAINDACLVLETRLRDLSGLDKQDFGKRLVDKALRPTDGKLILGDTEPEKEGWWRTYDGYLQSFRNSTGHRRVAASRARAAQIIGMADYLICQLQEAKQRTPEGAK